MLKWLIVPILCTLLCLSSCGLGSLGHDGGGGKIQETTVTTETKPDGSKTVTEHKVITEIKQPDNPKGPAILNYDNKGTLIGMNTGFAYNIGQIMQELELLKIPMWAGLGLAAIGGILILAAKQMKWGFTFIAIGAAMSIGSFLLAKYAIWFMIGLGVVAVYLLWIFKDYFTKLKNADQLVTTVDVAAAAGVIDKDKFGKIADAIQTKDTKKLVDDIQGS